MLKVGKMTRRGVLGAVATALTVAGFMGTAKAEFPEKPIEFVIPFGAGGGADIEGRVLADAMSKVLGVPVVPVNKTGGGGAVTYTYVKNSQPDGYTIAWNSTSILTSASIGNMDFDYTALDHLGQVEYQPMPFSVNGNSKWKTFQDFVDACKAAPGTMKIANSGTGSATHIAAVAIESAMGCKVIHLPVGSKRRNATVLSGESDAAAGPLTATLKLAKANKLRMLAIPSGKRNKVIPEIPTMKELGFNADLDLFRGLSVAKGTPDAIKAKLADAMKQAAMSPAFMGLSKKNGFTVDTLSMSKFVGRLAREGKVVETIMKSAGIFKSKTK